MQIIPMRELKNTVEIERRCAEENGPVSVPVHARLPLGLL